MQILSAWGLSLGLLALTAGGARSQNVTLDGTVGPAGRLTGPVYEIEQRFGTTTEANLFHSFGEFGLERGEVARFFSGAEIDNILVRVTGGTASSIDGLLFTDSRAVNLFLINPSGLLFGPNARLFVGGETRGSFFATTLDGLVWPDGRRFDGMEPPGVQPLLNLVGDPSGFVASQRMVPSIEMQSQGFAGRPGQSMVLLGGDVLVDNAVMGILPQTGGPLTLGGITGAETVALQRDGNAWTLGFPVDAPRGDIRITGGSLVTVRSNEQGSLEIYGRDVEISEGSRVLAGITANGGFVGAEAGDLSIEAQRKVNVRDGSQISNDVNFGGTGNSGNLEVKTDSLLVENNSFLSALTSGNGNSGSVIIDATDDVSLDGQSGTFSRVGVQAVGQAGGIFIKTGQLGLTNGSQLSAATFGTGNAGEISVEAKDQILIDQNNNLASFSGIFSTVEEGAVGDGGNINIRAGSLDIKGGARLTSSTFSAGNAGNISIKVDGDTSVSGAALNGFFASRIASQLGDSAVGSGGDINISTRSLDVFDFGELVTSSVGNGSSGDIQINARGRVSFENRSSARATFGSSSRTTAIGGSGDILITADSLMVSGSSFLAATSFAEGDSGNIKINIQNEAVFDDSFILSQIQENATGSGEDIEISAGNLELKNGAQFSTATFGRGNAGNILVSSDGKVVVRDGLIRGLRRSGFFSTVEEDAVGNGGNIYISADTLEMTRGAEINTTTSGHGDAGDITIKADNQISSRIRDPLVDDRLGISNSIVSFVDSTGKGDAGNIDFHTNILDVSGRTSISASTLGLGDGGNIFVNVRDSINFDNSNLFSRVNSSNSVGDGGDIKILTSDISLTNGSQFDSSTFGNGDSGNIEIDAARSITVAGAGLDGRASAIFSTNGDTAKLGTGRSGSIRINSPVLRVGSGGVIDSRTFNAQSGGDIDITVGKLELIDGGQIFTTSVRDGEAGSININADIGVSIAGIDTDYSNRVEQFGSGRLGVLSEESSLSVFAEGTGVAGSIKVKAPWVVLSDRGTIIADSNAVDGGNIFIDTSSMLLRRNSAVSATAGIAEGSGNGGNIAINSSFLIAFPDENSDIVANAFEGTGGNITINADAILNFQLTDEPDIERLRTNTTNDISASSQFGSSGTLNLAGLNVDPSQGVAQLPVDLTDRSNQIDRSCAPQTTASNSLILSGRSGLPLTPQEPQSSATTPQPWLPLPAGASAPNLQTAAEPQLVESPAPLREAAGWQQNSQGKTVLVAGAAKVYSAMARCFAVTERGQD